MMQQSAFQESVAVSVRKEKNICHTMLRNQVMPIFLFELSVGIAYFSSCSGDISVVSVFFEAKYQSTLSIGVPMAYRPIPRATRTLYRAFSCPFRFGWNHCAGGDYCPFPSGHDRLCCFFCPSFESCPDPEGVCQHFKDE